MMRGGRSENGVCRDVSQVVRCYQAGCEVLSGGLGANVKHFGVFCVGGAVFLGFYA